MIESCAISEDLIPCTTCKHYYRTWSDIIFRMNPTFAKCGHSITTKTRVDPVTGKTETKTEMEFCATQRRGYQVDTDCGITGQYWTPKNNKDLFKLIKRI